MHVFRDDNPCHNCPDRTATCHDDCEKHQLWKAERHAREEYIRREKHTRAQINSIHRNAVTVTRRGKRKTERE